MDLGTAKRYFVHDNRDVVDDDDSHYLCAQYFLESL